VIVELKGKHFKALIKAVTRFPSVGNFAGADLVNLQVVDGKATATTFGIVLARARVPAAGVMSLVGIERRAIESYCAYISEKSSVTIKTDGGKFVAKSGERETTLAMDQKVAAHKLPRIKDLPQIEITEDIAARATYLADVAYNDTSRAELCCVMLAEGGMAIAVDQTTFAVLTVATKAANVPIPLPLAKQLQAGDVLYLGERETVLVSGIGTYSMPSPVKALKDFPLALVKKLGEAKREKAAVVDGKLLAEAIGECGGVVGSLARTETIITISTSSEKRLHFAATNGGAEYKTSMPALSVKGEFVFRLPLDGVIRALPFMADKVTMSQSEHGDLYLDIGSGWCLFPGWQDPKKRKK